MILGWLVIIPLAGGFGAWLLGRRDPSLTRLVSLGALVLDLGLVLTLLPECNGDGFVGKMPWVAELKIAWIPELGIGLHLGLDGLSFLMVVLTLSLGIISVLSSWTEIKEKVGAFHGNLLWVLSGIIGVFLALDLFLFYFFWELMLVPMYFLIALWGHENRSAASMKFFIFTQLSGLLMLLSILGLYIIHGRATGVYTFDYFELLGTPMNSFVSLCLMLGFFAAFAVKLPVVPFHSWLPDAHTEAPTGGSVILAGLLLKTGAYGFLRFLVPLFPRAVSDFAPVGMALAVVGILYGAILAFAQTDLKRLVAYTSISHMGFVLLGVLAWNEVALQGAVMQMLCHGISTGALFVLAGALQERMHSRDMRLMGGLWSTMPRMGGAGLVFGLASLGLPGMGNFIGEFLVLLGSYRVSIMMTVLATAGLILAAVYALWMIQQVFHGPRPEGLKQRDLSLREMSVMTVMIAAILWLGLYPRPVLTIAAPVVEGLQQNLSEKEIKDKSTGTVPSGHEKEKRRGDGR
ncbi:MAG TPA: NADH-quinone oxidoreductase subunit M [Thermodesulfovibrionales bacterium]|nr:NADH-quinone oxidoreductase subunit M [Thermodesulfovibrionales bacterium]